MKKEEEKTEISGPLQLLIRLASVCRLETEAAVGGERTNNAGDRRTDSGTSDWSGALTSDEAGLIVTSNTATRLYRPTQCPASSTLYSLPVKV